MGDGRKPDEFESNVGQQVEGATSMPAEGREREEEAGELVSPADPGLDGRFRLALALYGVLGLLVWFTMGDGKVLVHGKPVELRLVPLIVLGGLLLRTVVAHRAEKIRQGGASGSSL